MGKQNDVGVFQLENGKWAFRYTFTKNGKRSSKRSCKDEFGNSLNTKRAAIKARQIAVDAEALNQPLKPVERKTVAEVFKEYREKGCSGKAYQTIRKQDSLWENHIRDKFGSRYVDDITVAEVNDYLTELYYVDDYTYKYTESFLKIFYLIFGQAYSRNCLSVDIYSKLCMNKDTKIKMPKLKTDEDTEIVTFSEEEISLLDEYFKGTNAETAYLLGKYCGLRISECYGLKWDHVNFENNSISIDRQMQYQAKDGKLYVSAIFDCFDSSVLGLAMESNMKATLCEHTLDNAYLAYPDLRGAIVHSDRGTQYTSETYRKALAKYGIIQSMNSAGGRCHDNARCESMWARMKSELLYDRYNTETMNTEELKVLIWRYFISYWNNRRICSANGGLPPMIKRQRYYESLGLAA